MVHITGRYGTRHPKDQAARRMQSFRRMTQEQGCTRRELDDPSERNVQKCMKEMTYSSKIGEQYKEDGKYLGENTDVNKFRRR